VRYTATSAPPGAQPPAAHQSASAVATSTGQHQDSTASGVTFQEAMPGQMGQIPASVLRHLKELDAIFRHHSPVYLVHLLWSDKRYFHFACLFSFGG
jgi:hypothetical protein